MSQCRDELLISCRESLKRIDLDREYYVEYGVYWSDGRYDGEARPMRCKSVYGWDGRKNDPPKADGHVKKFRVETVKMRDLPVILLDRLFERGVFDILERLSIGEVLALRTNRYNDDCQDGKSVMTCQEMLDGGLENDLMDVLESGEDSSMESQPTIDSFTDELFYQYDFGDDWKIRITGSLNCADLVEDGKITQDMLDKSNIKVRVTYRPVLPARDGEMLIDDVGGASGMAGFIWAINTMNHGETDENGMNKTALKGWAKSQGWHKDNSTDYSLL